MSTTKRAPAKKAAGRPAYEPDWVGRLTTQSGPRTTAPMWARPLLTDGEWAVYTALWSFGDWDGSSAFPTHQKLADRAFVARGTAANAVQKFDRLGLFTSKGKNPDNPTDPRNHYVLLEVPTAKLIGAMRAKLAEREQEQIVARGKRKQAKKTPRKNADETPGNPPSPAETPAVGGTPQDVPPQTERGTSQDVPPGTSCDVPGGYTAQCTHTYPGFDPVQVTNSPPALVTPCEQPPARGVVAAEGGEFDDNEENPEDDQRSPLERIVAALVAASGEVWDADVTRDVLETLVRAGRPADDIVRIATEVAQGVHGVTQSPRRLLGWWPSKPAAGAAQVVEPDWARGPVTYLDASRERCRTHPSEPSGTCGRCKSDRTAVDADEPVTTFELPPDLAALSPIAAAKAMAARAKSGRTVRPRSPEPVDEPTGPPPAPAGALFGAVAAQIRAQP